MHPWLGLGRVTLLIIGRRVGFQFLEHAVETCAVVL